MSDGLLNRSPAAELFGRALIMAWRSGVRLYDPSIALAREPDIESKLLRDPDIAMPVKMRQHLIAGQEWYIEPASDSDEDRAAAKVIKALVEKTNGFTQARHNLARAFLSGQRFGAFQGETKRLKVGDGRERAWNVITRIVDHDKRRFRYVPVESKDGSFSARLEVLSIPVGDWVEVKHPSLLVKHTYDDSEEMLGYGRGLREALYWWWYAKEHVFRESLQAIERFGQGIVTAKINGAKDANGMPNTELISAWRDVLAAMRSEHVLIHDSSDEVDVKDMAGSGWQLMSSMRDELRVACRVLILGANLTTGGGDKGGSYALADVQKDSTEALVHFDRETLEETLSEDYIGYLWRANLHNLRDLGLEGAEQPRFKIKSDRKMDTATFAQALAAAQASGMEVVEEEAYAGLGLTPPKDGDVVLQPPGAAGGAPPGGMPPGAPPGPQAPRGSILDGLGPLDTLRQAPAGPAAGPGGPAPGAAPPGGPGAAGAAAPPAGGDPLADALAAGANDPEEDPGGPKQAGGAPQRLPAGKPGDVLPTTDLLPRFERPGRRVFQRPRSPVLFEIARLRAFAWDESLHPRGDSKNAGHFAPGGRGRGALLKAHPHNPGAEDRFHEAYDRSVEASHDSEWRDQVEANPAKAAHGARTLAGQAAAQNRMDEAGFFAGRADQAHRLLDAMAAAKPGAAQAGSAPPAAAQPASAPALHHAAVKARPTKKAERHALAKAVWAHVLTARNQLAAKLGTADVDSHMTDSERSKEGTVAAMLLALASGRHGTAMKPGAPLNDEQYHQAHRLALKAAGELLAAVAQRSAGAPKAFAWDESKHPRDDHGRFITKDEIAAAAKDPAKLAALHARVSDPKQKARLDEAVKAEGGEAAAAPASNPTPGPGRVPDPRIPKPGTKITRTWRGTDYVVEVRENGYALVQGNDALAGKLYGSLTALTKDVTGAASINGVVWWGLGKAKPPGAGTQPADGGSAPPKTEQSTEKPAEQQKPASKSKLTTGLRLPVVATAESAQEPFKQTPRDDLSKRPDGSDPIPSRIDGPGAFLDLAAKLGLKAVSAHFLEERPKGHNVPSFKWREQKERAAGNALRQLRDLRDSGFNIERFNVALSSKTANATHYLCGGWFDYRGGPGGSPKVAVDFRAAVSSNDQTVYHELGHALHFATDKTSWIKTNHALSGVTFRAVQAGRSPPLGTGFPKGAIATLKRDGKKPSEDPDSYASGVKLVTGAYLAERNKYALADPLEFVAECFRHRMLGRRLSPTVARMYAEFGGPDPRQPAKEAK